MTSIPGTPAGPSILHADDQGPWSGGKGGSGPRNPWSVPPSGKRGPVKPTALDELLKRTRGGGGGMGGGGAGGGRRPEPRALWAIGIALILLLWLAFTSIHPIGPQQRGVVTFFGSYSDTLDPGIRLTLPAPIQTVRTVDVQKIRTDNFPVGEGENLMLTGDQNVVDLAYSVRWDIQNPQQFVFQLKNPEQTVRDAAESAMRAVLATTTFTQATGNGRTVVEAKVADLTQRILDSYASGVRIQGVSIRQANPPARIIEDFNAVTVAQQGAVTNLNLAQQYANQVVAQAQGEAVQFDKIYAQYKLAPEVTRRRLYYDTMEAVLAKSDKTILESGGAVPYLPLAGAKPAASPPAAPAEAAPAEAGQ
jgi:membrane protease subunit HflK